MGTGQGGTYQHANMLCVVTTRLGSQDSQFVLLFRPPKGTQVWRQLMGIIRDSRNASAQLKSYIQSKQLNGYAKFNGDVDEISMNLLKRTNDFIISQILVHPRALTRASASVKTNVNA